VAIDHKTGQVWVIGNNGVGSAGGFGIWAAEGAGHWVTTPDPNFDALTISAGAGQAEVTRSSGETDTVTCQ
jgi:hypothetical protein